MTLPFQQLLAKHRGTMRIKKEPPDVTLTKNNKEIRRLGFSFHWHIDLWVEKNEIDNFIRRKKFPFLHFVINMELSLA